MALFDRYIAVDWSAANSPRRGTDSIWIAEWSSAGLSESRNPSTREEAMAELTTRLLAAREKGQRVLVGCDFAFGYPQGAAAAIAAAMPDIAGEAAGWHALWSILHGLITDAPDNSSNRFQVAAAINAGLAAPHYWGHPHQHSYKHLSPTRPDAYAVIPERRRAEALARSAQPVWKLTGAGAVGSQALLGIARLEALRQHPSIGAQIAIWPFETGFADALNSPITIAEIYPSLFPLDDPAVLPKDRAQVETVVRRFADLDAAGLLQTFLSAPAYLASSEREIILTEEGWIAGIGHEALLAPSEQAA